jgi:hypothetical protein
MMFSPVIVDDLKRMRLLWHSTSAGAEIDGTWTLMEGSMHHNQVFDALSEWKLT